MRFRSKTPSASLINSVLAGMALIAVLFAWLVPSGHIRYASAFNQPRLDDPSEATHMQKAFEEIVGRRDVKLSLEKQKEIARIFHDLDIWQNMWFLGIPIQKNPCDLWMMQQIIYETKPDVIVETGTFRGGSALFFAHALNGMGLEDSQVITVDIEDACREAARLPIWQNKVQFIKGSSTDPDIVAKIHRACTGKRVMVVLDSIHESFHVIKELELYAPLVSRGGYVIVEDTNCDGIPIFPGSVGPTAAVQKFLSTPRGKKFTQDASREAMVLTFNPGGWLKRVD